MNTIYMYTHMTKPKIFFSKSIRKFIFIILLINIVLFQLLINQHFLFISLPLFITFTIISSLFNLFSIYYYFLTCSKDPGIIPINYKDYSLCNSAFINTDQIMKDYLKMESDKKINEENASNEKLIEVSEVKVDKIRPHIFTKRDCITCNIKKPPSVSHCSKCMICVFGFDQ